MQEDQIRKIAREEARSILEEGSAQREFLDAIFKWFKWGVGLLVAAVGIAAALKYGNEQFGSVIKEKVGELREVGISELVERSRAFSAEGIEVYEANATTPSRVIENAALCALTQTSGACSLTRDNGIKTRWNLVSGDNIAQCSVVCVPVSGADEMRLAPAE